MANSKLKTMPLTEGKGQNSRLSVWLITDVFPPASGGSGWSTYYLGKALVERGHSVRVVRPRYGESVVRPTRRVVEYEGLPVEEVLVPAAPSWATRLGMGKAWEERRAVRLLTRYVSDAAIRGEVDIIHGQHIVSVIASSQAARLARRQGGRVRAVGTVRDYWPLCPVSTRLFTNSDGSSFECEECHRLPAYMECVGQSKGRKVSSLPVALLRWVKSARAGRALGRCDAVIAVSDYVRGELERSKRVNGGKLVTLPNMVDLASVDNALLSKWPLTDIAPGDRFLLFVGKWDLNKGAQMLPEVVKRSGIKLPVVLAGEGLLRDFIQTEAAQLDLDFRFYDWLDNDAAILLMRHATALLFPSAWQEPLSRVLLEGCAAGAAIVVLDTGGTRDVISHGESGWLAHDMSSFAEGIRAVVDNAELSQALRTGARHCAEEKFASDHVSARVETLYRRLLA
ncbi:MAG TPA: glycosyltransferase family 4 protein [Chloroflexia bacterium]|nr:glycosyltransferase family 4 protein [Chloroflexia bacterium]